MDWYTVYFLKNLYNKINVDYIMINYLQIRKTNKYKNNKD